MDEPNLPEIDYSLVTSTLFRIGRYQVDSSDETLKYADSETIGAEPITQAISRRF